MTFTLSRPAAIIAIAFVGILMGLALGRVNDADSAGAPPAAASYVSPFEQDVKKMGRQLGAIKAALGEKGYIDPDVMGIPEGHPRQYLRDLPEHRWEPVLSQLGAARLKQQEPPRGPRRVAISKGLLRSSFWSGSRMPRAGQTVHRCR